MNARLIDDAIIWLAVSAFWIQLFSAYYLLRLMCWRKLMWVPVIWMIGFQLLRRVTSMLMATQIIPRNKIWLFIDIGLLPFAIAVCVLFIVLQFRNMVVMIFNPPKMPTIIPMVPLESWFASIRSYWRKLK